MGYKNWMLVEGRNDQYILRSLLRHHGINCAIPDREKYGEEAIVIDQRGNVEGVLDALKIVLDDGDLARLAVIVDADTNIDGRWDALRNILMRFGGEETPHSPAPEGTVISLARPYRTLRVGVWLMPDNRVPGILEDFVAFLIPDENTFLWQHAVDSVAKIPAEQRNFPAVALPKAEIHTWLAWQKEPGQPFGLALTAKYLDSNAPYALNLVSWVQRVFELS
ncbi:MAG: hypothetical protein K8R89_01985 [Anaerolineae bacterium]|nr:hypothetical protein [Anaerolineae bacterium]